jgi:hypothetical protein
MKDVSPALQAMELKTHPDDNVQDIVSDAEKKS